MKTHYCLGRGLLVSVLVFAVSGVVFGEAELRWRFTSPAGYVDTSPALGDLDGDGRQEIVLATTAGGIFALDGLGQMLWDRSIRGPITVPPTVADCRGDASPEILVLNKPGQLYCLDGATGSPIWDRALPAGVEWGTTAILAKDLDGDAAVDIVVGDQEGHVLRLDGDGQTAWTYAGDHGWTLCPAAGDLDGDGRDEIVFGGTKTPLVCLSAAGKERWRVDSAITGASPVLWDLDGDGALEVVSGIGNALAAVNADGSLRWSHPMPRELDAAISVADADGDGTPEIYAVDLAGAMVCLSPAGLLRWEAKLGERVRRSPTIADVDGDGVAEILVAGYNAALHVFRPDGSLLERVALGGTTNAAPTVTRLADGGGLAVICAVKVGEVLAYEWPDAGGDGRVLWPEYRMNSARIAAPAQREDGPNITIASIDFGGFHVGSNTFSVAVDNPDALPLVLRLSATQSKSAPSNSEITGSDTTLENRLPYLITGDQAVNVSLTCEVEHENRVVARRQRRVYIAPFEKELADAASCLAKLAQLVPRLPDPSGVDGRVCLLASKLPAFQTRVAASGTLDGEARRSLRNELHAFLDEATDLAAMLEAASAAAATVRVSAANPWAPFGGMDELREGRLLDAAVQLEAFHGEVESGALNVYNFSGETRSFRVVVDGLNAEQHATVPGKTAIELREAVLIPTEMRDYSADALPLLNQGAMLTVPAWDARQLWLNVDTASLAPGAWKSAIRLRSLDVDPIETQAALEITVWDTPLPKPMPLRLCHWGYVHSSVLKDQPEAALADQVGHGTNVFVGLFSPKATFDETGALVGDIDFTEHDAYMKRHAPHGIVLFYGYQRGLTGPASEDSDAYAKAHVAWLRAWVAHLDGLGVGYDGYALYPIDEPGLRDGLVERNIRFGQLARQADPKIQLYTDPVGRITMAELEGLDPYVDIWCPNRNGFLLHEGAEKLAFIKKTGNTVWTYECEGHAKHQSPLGYYRGLAWLAWRHGLTGIGFWSYCTSGDDPWFRPAVRQDYLLIYQGNGVVPSKRWEAVRDGLEDYAMLKRLAEAAEKAAPGASRERAQRLLDADATAIAQFCGLDDGGTLPGAGGMPEARKRADTRWHAIQEARRAMAALLSKL